MHSATKFIDGQGRCIGGAVAGSHDLMEEVYGVLRTTGQTLSPFNAWVFLKGLETLNIRMKAHCESTQILAEWLTEQDAIEKVFYCDVITDKFILKKLIIFFWVKMCLKI